MVYSITQGAYRDIGKFRPVFQDASFTVDCQPYIPTLISCLLRRGGPITITWFIVAVVVSTINRVLRTRGIAHISVEVFKDVPPLACLNSAPAIASINSICWSATPAQHSRPNFIHTSVVHSMLYVLTFTRAITRSWGVPTSIKVNNSALTPSRPVMMFWPSTLSCIAKNCQRADSVAGNVFNDWWWCYKLSIKHVLVGAVTP